MSKEAFEKIGHQIVNFVHGLEHLLKYAVAGEFVNKAGLHVTVDDTVPGDEHWVARSRTGDRSAKGDTWLEAVTKYMEDHGGHDALS